MIRYLQHRFQMSRKGARNLIIGTLTVALQSITFFLPVLLLYLFLQHFIMPLSAGELYAGEGVLYYALWALAFALIIILFSHIQYNSVYPPVYNESAAQRITIAEKLRKLPLSYFSEKNLSDLTSTILSDVASIETIFSHAVPQLIGSILVFILAIFGLGSMSWPMTLSFFWVLPVVIIAVFLIRRMTMRRFTEGHAKRLVVVEKIQEGFDQIHEIKSYSGEERYLAELHENLTTYERSQMGSELFVGVIASMLKGIVKLGLPVLILVGVSEFLAGSTDLATLIIFLVVAATIFDPIYQVFEHTSLLFYLDVRINRLREINELSVQSGSTKLSPDGFTLRFDDVSFAYNTGEMVLQNVSFVAKQGSVTALIGPSGGGKSTAARLAARFWDAQSGTITLGGVDIATVDPEALLQYYSIVFQDVVLFNASVMDNIRIGRKDATDEEVLAAARFAQCDDFVQNLPQGYNTEIGENGSTLSGGERQRISIARAILKDAPIILLDEATASLDVENETKLQRALSTLIQGKTVLIIAHRMRTIRNADHIVVLREGRVVEQGSPAELLQQKGVYARMVELQQEVKAL